MKRILFSIVSIFLISAGRADKNAQSAYQRDFKRSGSVQTSRTWMSGAEKSVGCIKVYSGTGLSGIGTGFLIDYNRVVTNFHVVNGADSAKITFPSGLTLSITGIVAEDDENDLAVLTIAPAEDVPPPLLFAPVPARVGDKLVCYGYPMGPNQKLTGGNVTSIGPFTDLPLALIANMPTAAGFSGGPVLNDQHQVVGVMTSDMPRTEWEGKGITRTEWEGKEIIKEGSIMTPAHLITSLSMEPSRSLQEWTKARGNIAISYEECVLGKIAFGKKDYDRAFQHFQTAIQIDPNNYRAWSGQGKVFERRGMSDQAMSAFGKSIELKPQLFEAWRGMGNAFTAKGRCAEAVGIYEDCLRRNPNNDSVLLGLGTAYVNDCQPEKAREMYNTLNTINPEAAKCLLDYIQSFPYLLAAAEAGKPELVKILLEKGADVNAKDKNGTTALMLASDKGHVVVVKVLLEKGADVNAKDKNGTTALMLASKGNTEIVRLLLDKGADVNAQTNDGTWTSLRLAKLMRNTEIVELLEKSGAKETGAAVFDKNPEKVETKKSETSIADKNAQLFQAAKDGNLDAVKSALAEGADVDAKDSGGNTPLMVAVAKDQKEIVMVLLEKGADVNAKTNNGYTALTNAVLLNNMEMVRFLTAKNADVNVRISQVAGSPILHLAAVFGYTEIVSLLLESGADINARSLTGYTALINAVQNGHASVVNLLIERGADVDAGTNDGKTALIIAQEKNYTEIIKLLEKAGAKE